MSFKHGYALLIGTGTHKYHPEIDLPVIVRDAQAVAEVLRDKERCGYQNDQVQLLHDEEASKSRVLAALDALSATGQDDTVFFFYCGHGALGTDGNYYLVTHDARLERGRVVSGTGVSVAELLTSCRTIPAQRVLLIFNACYAGNVSPSLAPSEETLSPRSLSEDVTAALLATGSGRIIITACREDQKSWVGFGACTIFTQALVDGLSGKRVRNNGGYISAFSLYEHLYETVSESVEAQLQEVQEPELTVLKGVGPFAVSLYKGARELGAFDAREVPPAAAAVHQFAEHKSKRFMRQIITEHQTGGVNIVGPAHVHVGGDLVGGNKIELQDGVKRPEDSSRSADPDKS